MPARPKAEESGERDKDPPGGERKAGSSEDKRDTGARGGEDRSQRADAAEGQPWLSERVKKACRKVKVLMNIRKSRPFGFLHMFSERKINLAFQLKPRRPGRD